MSKTKLVGVGVLVIGAAFGFVVGGAVGLLFAALCLVVGLVVLASSHAQRTELIGEQATRPAHQKTHLLFLVKEVHARPQKAGKFQEILDPQQEGLEFELFLYCWLVNETDLPVRLADEIELTVSGTASTPLAAERLRGDLEKWRLGKLNKQADSWDVLVIRAAQESMAELNTSDALECGVPRSGWLHFRVRGLTPADLQTSTIELRAVDSLSNVHQTTVSCPKQVPGRIWPFRLSEARSIGSTQPTA